MWLAMVNSFPSLDLELLDTLVLCSILYVFRIATCKYDLVLFCIQFTQPRLTRTGS